MEHKTILCSEFPSNSGLVPGAVMKNCRVDSSSGKLVTESPAMGLAEVARVQLTEDWIVYLETLFVASALSPSVELEIRHFIFVLDLGFFSHKKRQLV